MGTPAMYGPANCSTPSRFASSSTLWTNMLGETRRGAQNPFRLPPAFTHTVHLTTALPGQSISQDSISRAEFEDMVCNGIFAVHERYGDSCSGITMHSLVNGAAINSVAIVRAVIAHVQQLKATPGLDARYVYIKPPCLITVRSRIAAPQSETGIVRLREPVRKVLAQIGCNDQSLEERGEAEYTSIPDFYDFMLPSEDLDEINQYLMDVIYA